jgi:hypothetical protein
MSQQMDIATISKGYQMAKKVAELSAEATAVLGTLKNATAPMTLAQLKEVLPTANVAHLNALRTRSLVQAEEVEITVQTKRTVLAYRIKAE